jgi:hypothetical protein
VTERELLIDCARRLNEVGLPYMLTGSMVSNYWGIPRTTHDLDFVVQLPTGTIPKMVETFSGDYYLDEGAVRAAFRPPYQFNAIDTRSPLKIDFWLLQPKPFEQNMFSRRLRVTLFAQAIWICTAEDVVLHKLYWNRMSPSERQVGDAAGVVAVQAGALDVDYLRTWATELGVLGALEDLLSGRIRPKQT